MQFKYVDYRPIFIPKLKNYKNGITLPNKTNIIEIVDKEAKTLLKMKNGDKPCFEIHQERKRYERVTEE